MEYVRVLEYGVPVRTAQSRTQAPCFEREVLTLWTEKRWGFGFSSCAVPLIWNAPIFQRVENRVDSEE